MAKHIERRTQYTPLIQILVKRLSLCQSPDDYQNILDWWYEHQINEAYSQLEKNQQLKIDQLRQLLNQR